MKLLRLDLDPFKGARRFTLEPDGDDINVFGDNGTGKTTLFDAYTWGLFGKDSLGQTDFDIRMLVGGEPQHGNDPTVEIELETETGLLTLLRTLKDKIVKERGSAVSERKGNTTEYRINTVKVSEREYMDRVAGICDERRLRTLSDPFFFNTDLFKSGKEPAWRERRKLLIDVCGDVTDADVIAARHELKDFPEMLGRLSVDDFRRNQDELRKSINDELKKLPERIDEANRIMPPSSTASESEITANLDRLRKELEAMQDQRAELAAGGDVANLSIAIREVEISLKEIADRIKERASEGHGAARSRAAEIESEIASARIRETSGRNAVASIEAFIARLDAQLARLREEWRQEKAAGFAGPDACATCGQPLPSDQVEAALARHNTAKAERLEANKREGAAIAAQRNQALASLDDARKTLETVAANTNGLYAALKGIALPGPVVLTPADLMADPDYAAKAAERERLTEELANVRAGSGAKLEALEEEMRRLQTRIWEVDQALANIRLRSDCESRITLHRNREKELGRQAEAVQRNLHLCEVFTRSKVSLLTEKINSRFELATFRLFEANETNDGIKEVCEVCVNGVPYSSLNHASKVNVGLDIINTLADHYGFAPPVWIDGAESVTNLLPTRGQQIRLIVSEPDKELRITTTARTQPAQKELITA